MSVDAARTGRAAPCCAHGPPVPTLAAEAQVTRCRPPSPPDACASRSVHRSLGRAVRRGVHDRSGRQVRAAIAWSLTYDRGRRHGAACGRTPIGVRAATMNYMSDQPIRASDAERDESAKRIQSATAEGRLTFEEADERLDAVLASRFRHELTTLVADLPDPATAHTAVSAAASVSAAGEDPQVRADGRGLRRRGPTRTGSNGRWALGIHAAVVVLISLLMIARWAISGVPYFWPMFPMFWLLLSLVLHTRRRASRPDWARM